MTAENEKYAESIRQLIPINELPPRMQNEVINKGVIMKGRKGSYIFKQGERDDFSYYLLEGEIEMHANEQQHNVITAGLDRARYAMAQLQPRQFSAKAKTAYVVLQIRRDELDKLLVLQDKEQAESSTSGADMEVAEMEISEIEDEEAVDWMTRTLQSELFSRMPTANIHQLFALLEPIEFKSGDVVIKQGDPGEHYFIIQEGRCQVSRKPQSGGKAINLAVLEAGDCFGEEALISEMTRNATVSMLTDGILMQLSKDNFIELIEKPTLQSVSYDDALKLVEEGPGVWLDVRFKNEHEESAIEGSQNIPLNILRMQARNLARDKRYVVYCDTGGRSSTAAFLLAENGLDACFLGGGLVNNPQAARSSEVTQAPSPEQKKEKTTPAAKKEAPLKAVAAEQTSVVEEITKQDIDPGVKASVLEAELAKTNMQLKNVKEVKHKADNISVKEMQAEVERRLKEEHAKIEAAKKEAEKEAKRLHEQEEEKIRRMKEEAAKRMQAEKKKLDEVYTRNAEEMEKLQRMKQEAERQIKQEKKRLEREAEDARRKLQEAMQLKEEVVSSRHALEQEALKNQKDQEEKERKIQEKARQKLEEERRNLAKEFAHNHEELDKARRERAAAEASRRAAKEEAEQIIAEFKQKQDQERAVEEEKLRAERLKLEQEQRKIQETMKEIQQARDEAEKEKQAAIEETKRLRAWQEDKSVTKSKAGKASIKGEIKAAEEKISQANREIEQAEQAHVEAIAAKKVNEEDLIKKRAMEEDLHRQLESDLNEFREEQEEKESNFADIASQMEHMKRIKQTAEAAKRAAQQADSSLLDDIEAQLGENGD
ncbi:MAG: cyclic nucleotide-binding domain-containing protein [Gammaproteobacteria bacterium]